MIGGTALVSGKGGVGKSVICSTIIQDLLRNGKRIGACDFDFSNPNLGRLLRVPATADISITPDDKKLMIPAKPEIGLEFFSIEKIIQDRGVGMAGEDYAQIAKDVLSHAVWTVDYMVLDLPAVISSEFRTMISVFEENYLGSVIVAQPSHLPTTERLVKLHLINGVPILGILENMVSYECPDCHSTRYIFGDSGAEELSRRYNVPFLGKIPYDPKVLEQLQGGMERVRLQDGRAMDNVVRAILEAQPRKLGYIQEIKAGLKGISRSIVIKLFVQSVSIINQFVKIKELQEKHNFPGGATVTMQVFDKEVGEGDPITWNFRIQDGKLLVVKAALKPDFLIQIKQTALAWALMGKKKFPDGREIPYTLKDAWGNGDANVKGAGAVMRAISFYNDIWENAQSELSPRIGPVIEKLV